MKRNWITFTLLLRMKNGINTLENSSAVSYKSKYATSIWPRNCIGEIAKKWKLPFTQKHVMDVLFIIPPN